MAQFTVIHNPVLIIQTKKLNLQLFWIKSPVHIITMSNNGEKILDIDTFVGDGPTAQFVVQKI